MQLRLLGFWLAALALAIAPAGLRGQQAHWSYANAAHWGELDPAYAACTSGRQQSPIDIRDAVPAALPALRFEYRSGPLTIVNNGHSVQVDVAPGSYLVVGRRRYQLVQFHFHHPSEERLAGQAYAMDIHLVHRTAEGQLAVVAVQLRAGAGNAALARLWPYLPSAPGPERAVAGAAINLEMLLPADRSYYTYPGSLTTPPCSEGVTWMVLKTPVTLSPAQLEAFAKLYPHNARPLQALRGRVVKQSH